MRGAGLTGWLLGMALALNAPSIAAHALLVRSAPARDATLDRAPSSVTLWFNEPLEAAFSALDVLDAAGRSLAEGAVEAPEARALTRSCAPLGVGAYRVRYRVLSVDGHVVEGEFAFQVTFPPR